MAPVRRPEGDPPPAYGNRSTWFSVEINHGGHFVGHGRNRGYVDGRAVWFDQLDKVTWSTIMLENIVENIGWEMAGRVKAYYCVPMLSLERNGLRALQSDVDVDIMMNLLSIGYHFFSIYLDHDGSFLENSSDEDDVVRRPISTLPPDVSPCKNVQNRVGEEEPHQAGVGDVQAHVRMQVVVPDVEAPTQQQGGVDVGKEPAAVTEQVNPQYDTANRRTRRRVASTCPANVLDTAEQEGEEDACDSDFDPAIVDSDNDVGDDDDNLYADNVDEEEAETIQGETSSNTFKENRKQKVETDDEDENNSEDEDLWAPDSEDEGGKLRFRTFREVDLNAPKFHVGQVFDSIEMVRKAVREYSCQNRRDLKMPINDKKRVQVICGGKDDGKPSGKDDGKPCTWFLWVSYDSRTKCFMVKRHVDKHTCGKKWRLKAFTSKYLAQKYLDSFRADQNMSLQNFSRIIQKEWHMTPGRMKLQRARRHAMEIIHGDEEGQYKLLWDYANEVRRSNPGSSFYLSLDADARFNKLYMCLDASKRGFLQGCRPVIFVDGCHIKTRYRGQLLAAVGMDPNDCIFPIAIAVVEVEDTANWKWFLDTLKGDLCIINTAPWTIMSDKQKGLINAVNELFPEAEHRFCVRHMWQNFQQLFKGDVLKNQLWKIARSCTVTKFEQYMEEMKVMSTDAHNWLDELEPSTWVKAFQSDLPKCDVLLNNNCEVFNKYILDSRELPILSMIQRIKGQLMTRHYTKLIESEKWPGQVCPKIKKKVDKVTEMANLAEVTGAGDGLFHVGDRGTDYIVDIKKKLCTCGRYQKSGIPCLHVIACCRSENVDPLDLVDPCYSKVMFQKAYGNIIYPCKDTSEWQKMFGPPINPPFYQKHVGRPTKVRRKGPGEVPHASGGKKMSRHGVIMHCNYCKEADHNIAGCKYLKAGLPPPSALPPPIPTTSQEYVPPPNSTSSDGNVPPPVLDDLMVDNLSRQMPTPRVVQAQPVPESSFLTAAQMLLNQTQESQGSTSNLRQGELAQHLQALRNQKDREQHERKQALLRARQEVALKKAEDAAKKKHEEALKKAEQLEKRKQAAAERSAKKKEEARVNKLARERTRQIIADVKKECARKQEAERKAKRELQKQQAAAAKEEQKKKAAAAKEEEKRRAAVAKEDERNRVAAARAEEQRIAGLEIAYTRRMAAEAREEKEQEAALGAKGHASTGSSVVTHPPAKKTSIFDVFR